MRYVTRALVVLLPLVLIAACMAGPRGVETNPAAMAAGAGRGNFGWFPVVLKTSRCDIWGCS
jgi:hypothetical protein